MRLNCNSFFDGSFEYLNLNDFYLQNHTVISDTKNPALIQPVLDSLNKNTYGGYAENRKDVWHGTYMDVDQRYIHLGIDINVKAGTEVKCPFDAVIYDLYTDLDTQIGWGGRIILQQNGYPFLVLAHLEPKSLIRKTNVSKGEILGKVGTWPTNGNTFQHLHVQAVKELNLNNFDGYGFAQDLHNNPDPFLIDFHST